MATNNESESTPEGLPDDIRALLPEGTMFAKTKRRLMQAADQIVISSVMNGVTEWWFVSVVDAKRRVSVHGPGLGDPSPAVIEGAIANHWRRVFSRNAKYN